MKIHSKLKAREWSQHFSHNKSMGFFSNAQGYVTHKSLVGSFRRSRAANSEVSDGILPKFKLNQAFIVGLVTCKNEEDPLKNVCARVVTIFLPL